MRLWSIHPNYLDAKGLVALWREALLAQHVLLGHTKGYLNHPQLTRFKNSKSPTGAIACYLRSVHLESENRNYHFQKNKIGKLRFNGLITVTTGQLDYEFSHLLNKLKARDMEKYHAISHLQKIRPHPLTWSTIL